MKKNQFIGKIKIKKEETHKNHICYEPRRVPREKPIDFGCPNSKGVYYCCWYCRFG